MVKLIDHKEAIFEIFSGKMKAQSKKFKTEFQWLIGKLNEQEVQVE